MHAASPTVRKGIEMKRELEAGEQAALFDWAAIQAGNMPELRLLFHVPNGGLRSKSEAARMKHEGVKAGVPDLFLPVARGTWHGLFIEMKAAGGRPTAEQKAWIADLKAQGYRAEVCVGWEAAADLLKKYLRTHDDWTLETYPVCAFCGREIDGKSLNGKMIGGVMTCADCAETVVLPAIKKQG